MGGKCEIPGGMLEIHGVNSGEVNSPIEAFVAVISGRGEELFQLRIQFLVIGPLLFEIVLIGA